VNPGFQIEIQKHGRNYVDLCWKNYLRLSENMITNKQPPFGHAISILKNEAVMSHPVGDDSEQTAAYLDEKRKQLEAALTHLESAQIGGLGALVSLVREWGTTRNIIGPEAKATTQTQFEKLLEEVEELNVAISIPSHEEIVDAIGDCTVVLILLAELAGTRFETCLHSAYEVISKRTGRMENGMFVKDAPSDDDLNEPLPERTCTEEEGCASCQ
jgi:hypothetical protein